MSYEGGIWRRSLAAREFRWRCGDRNGRWRPTHDLAGEAAVSAGLATWEQMGRGRRLFLGPLVEIEARNVPARRISRGHKKSGADLSPPRSPTPPR